MLHRVRSLFSGLVLFSVLLGVSRARAESITAAPSASQDALAVDVSGGVIHARKCAVAEGCTALTGTVIEGPSAEGASLEAPRLRVIDLSPERRLVRVDGRLTASSEGSWSLLLAAGPTGPVVVWKGVLGVLAGEPGERHATTLVEERLREGTRIVVGEQYENATICGRKATISPREVDVDSLSLQRGAGVQSLDVSERAKSVKLVASRLDSVPAAVPWRLLKATAASSAVGRRMAALTDGDEQSAWSEDRFGDGRGEFVRLASSEDVGIQGIDFVVRPAAGELPDAAAPRTFYLATTNEIFEITMPEDAWAHPGARYRVAFPAAVHTDCVAVVLETAFAAADTDATRVTMAELSAHTEFDAASLDALAASLGAGAPRSRAAAALLARAGESAARAAIGVYDRLDDAGKGLARDVIDGATCATTAPFYAARMTHGHAAPAHFAVLDGDGEALHAIDRVRRCGRVAAPALSAIVTRGPSELSAVAARELASLAPSDAIEPIVRALVDAPSARRTELREALSRAAASDRASDALEKLFDPSAFAELPEAARIDVLRAVAPVLSRTPSAAARVTELDVEGAPFATRYLLLAASMELARAADASAMSRVRSLLRAGSDPLLRARAVELAVRVPSLLDALPALLTDVDPRVRESAALALAKASPLSEAAWARASTSLSHLLTSDPWTFVRVSAARATAVAAPNEAIDGALVAALDDASPSVRVDVITAIATRHVVAARDRLRQLTASSDEPLDVRAGAIAASGALCDGRWVDDWTRLVARLSSPLGDVDTRLGVAALEALALIRPADFHDRVAPLLAPSAPARVREIARSFEASTARCR